MRLKEGDTVKITVEGIVMDTSDGHGLCYQIVLPQSDFAFPRTIWFNPHEIELAEKERATQS